MTAPLAPVTSRPVRSSRIAIVAATAVVTLFSFGGVLLRTATSGVEVNLADHLGLIGTGLLLGALTLTVTRPRLRVDATGVDTRGFLGGWRHIDWDLIKAIEFPPKARFARLVLPGDELIPLYAVQRGDRERSVAVMNQLRRWHASVTS